MQARLRGQILQTVPVLISRIQGPETTRRSVSNKHSNFSNSSKPNVGNS
jgi:hypothetical protein